MPTGRLLLVAVVLLAASTAHASDFTDCLCWNVTTDKWCGNAANSTENHFYRDPCKSYARDSLLWTLPAMLLLLGFVGFPIVFCAARCCCNCCGGKHASDGICCPSQVFVEDATTGERVLQPKTYSNRTIFCTKGLFWLVFGFWIYFSVGVYHINDQVHWALLTTIDRTQHEIDTLASDSNQTSVALAEVAARGGASLLPSTLLAQAASATSGTAELAYHTRLVIGNITRAESDQGWGRNEFAYRTPSIALTLLVIAVFFLLCNCHNGGMSVLAGLFAWSAAFVVLVFIVHATLAQGATALCDNYNDTVIPLLLDIAESKGGCGVDSVVQAFDAAGQTYVSHACDNGSTTTPPDALLFGGLQELCTGAGVGLFAGCPPAVPALCATRFNWPGLATAVVTVHDAATATAATGCAGCNISTCAAGGCTNPQALALAQQFATFATAFAEPMAYIFATRYPDYVNCTGLAEAIAFRSPVQYALCDSFSTDFSNIAILFLELSLLALPAVLVLVLGAKRFRKMQSLAAPNEDLQIASAADFINGVLLPSAADKAMFGEPILTPSQAKRRDDAHAAEPLLREASMRTLPPNSEKTIQGL